MEPCYRNERRFCAKEGESIPIIKGRDERDAQVHSRTTEEMVH